MHNIFDMTVFIPYWLFICGNVTIKYSQCWDCVTAVSSCCQGSHSPCWGWWWCWGPSSLPSPSPTCWCLRSGPAPCRCSLPSAPAASCFVTAGCFLVNKSLNYLSQLVLKVEMKNLSGCLPRLVVSIMSGSVCLQTVTNCLSLWPLSLSVGSPPSLSLYLYRISRMTTLARTDTKVRTLKFVSKITIHIPSVNNKGRKFWWIVRWVTLLMSN